MAGPLDNALAILGGGQQKQDAAFVPPTDPVWRVPVAEQRARDGDRLLILQHELSQATDPTSKAALQREIASTQQGMQEPQNGPLSGALSILGGSYQPGPNAPQSAAKPPSLADRAISLGKSALRSAANLVAGPADAAMSLVSGGTTGVLGAVGGALGGAAGSITSGDFGTQEGVHKVDAAAGAGMDKLTYAPRTPFGQDVTHKVGDVLERSGIQGVPIPELNNMTAAARPAAGLAANAVRAGASRALQAVEGRPVAPMAATADAAPAAGLDPAQAPQPGAPRAPQPAPAAAPADGPLPIEEQTRRAQVLTDLGIKDARRSVITGDRKSGATDYQTSKLDNSAGRLMAAKFDEERGALDNFGDTLVRDSGGSIGTDQSALYGRGNTIIAPLDSLKQWFDQRASDLYKVADERSQGVPTTLDRFRTLLGDDSEMTNSDRVHLRGAINAYAKKLGLMDEDGNVFANGQQAETMRKFLGENWSPANGRFVGKLKDALDEDVMSSAGEDVYGQARQMWQLRKNTLDNPNGIAKIMDASGPEGINRSVAVERIPDAVTAMPVQQFQHVVETLKNVPEELRPQADAALAEIKAQYANKVLEAGRSTKGQWNAKAVRNYLTNNNERMQQVFTPEELTKFQKLRDAGEILATDQSYPGAAAQKHNLLRSGTMHAIRTGSTSVGAAIGGPIGAAVGSAVGEKAAGAFGDAAGLKAAQKRLVPLSSLINVGK